MSEVIDPFVRVRGPQVEAHLEPGERLRSIRDLLPESGDTGRNDPDVLDPDRYGDTFSDQRIAARSRAVGGSRLDRRIAVRRAQATRRARARTRDHLPPADGSGDAPASAASVLRGAPGSAARRFQAVSPPYGDATTLAVTDRRLLLFDRRPAAGGVDLGTPRFAVTADQVAGATLQSRLLRRARLRLDFTDGSWIILSRFSPLRSAKARPTLEAVRALVA